MATTAITITAVARTSHGKGPAGRLRSTGKLPAIVYGPGHTTRGIAIEPKDIKAILAAPLGRNTLVTLDVAGETSLALLKSFDHHPLTRLIEHADFYTVTLDRPILVLVPLLLTGKARGVTAEGGILRQVYRTLPVRCNPDKIPAKIEADVTNLGLGEGLHTRDLNLPEGIVVALDAGQTVASVVSPEKEERAATTDAVPGAAPAAGAPAAGAPAAGGKDAKAPAGGKDAKAPAAKAPAAKKK